MLDRIKGITKEFDIFIGELQVLGDVTGEKERAVSSEIYSNLSVLGRFFCGK
jgi:hypothetical protein